ncbi:MAG: hypothetical protein JXB00_02050 [Bacteroidales bacterium]|nr:hypothetical protein [Bacteroidales bacterium]
MPQKNAIEKSTLKILKYSVLLPILFLSAMNSEISAMNIILPDTFQNWKVSESVNLDDHDALYEYIDGGAEQFISYGYQHAVSKIYIKEGEPEVRVEIFDMGSSKNAYGIFSNIRYEENDEFGQGSQYVTGALFFWKSNYYISISTIEETMSSIKFIREMAKNILAQVPEKGPKPEILDILPEEGLDQNGILYFHHYIWLNSYFFISNDNILLINDDTDAVYAKYGTPENRLFLLVIDYKNEALLDKAYRSFVKHYLTVDITENIFQVEDNKWMALKSENNFLVLIFNGTNREEVENLLLKTTGNIQNNRK